MRGPHMESSNTERQAGRNRSHDMNEVLRDVLVLMKSWGSLPWPPLHAHGIPCSSCLLHSPDRCCFNSTNMTSFLPFRLTYSFSTVLSAFLTHWTRLCILLLFIYIHICVSIYHSIGPYVDICMGLWVAARGIFVESCKIFSSGAWAPRA